MNEAIDRGGCCAGWPRPCSYHEGALDGRDEERAAVVEWLGMLVRVYRKLGRLPAETDAAANIAQAVELGEHRA